MLFKFLTQVNQIRHFNPLQVSNFEDIELDGRQLFVYRNDKKTSDRMVVNILAEEVGYNIYNKEYKIILIDQPLSISTNKPFTVGNIFAPLSPANTMIQRKRLTKLLKPPKPLKSHDDCSKYLEYISQELTTDLELKVKRLQSNYMILSSYLNDAASRIKKLTENYIPKYEMSIEDKNNTICESVRQAIRLSVENYVVYLLHGKLMASIYNKHEKDDKILMKKFEDIRNSKMTICHLGAQKAFEDFILNEEILRHIKRFCSLQSPLAIVTNLVKIFDSISEALNQSVKFKNVIGNEEDEHDVVSICSDDLIATLVFSLAHSRPTNLYSIGKYLDTFGWSSNEKDQAAYYTATFQIVIHYVFNYKKSAQDESMNDDNRSVQGSTTSPRTKQARPPIADKALTGKISRSLDQFIDSVDSCGSVATDSTLSLSMNDITKTDWELV